MSAPDAIGAGREVPENKWLKIQPIGARRQALDFERHEFVPPS
jgi:hypothetical protein